VKYLAILLVSIFFAGITAVGVSVADPPAAEAAGGGYAPKCGGGKIFLKADGRQTVALHNNARKNRNLRAFCVHPDLQQAAAPIPGI
jgi:hypothetical protein